jgi:hypothetical protein
MRFLVKGHEMESTRLMPGLSRPIEEANIFWKATAKEKGKDVDVVPVEERSHSESFGVNLDVAEGVVSYCKTRFV